MPSSKSKRPQQSLPSPITLSKVQRSDSITSLFIEEITSCEGCRKKRMVTGRPRGLRVTWTPDPVDTTIESNENNESSNARSPEPWMKWTCWIVILLIGLCFITLLVGIGMTQSSRNPIPSIIPETRSAQINAETNTIQSSPEEFYSTLMDLPRTPEKTDVQVSETDCPDDPACKNSTTFFCDGHVGNNVNQCVNYTFVCDGIRNCENGRDELECIKLTTNLKEIEPRVMPNWMEGYVLVRMRGIWHPYCSNEWSYSMGLRICDYLGQTKLDSMKLFSLEELRSKETGSPSSSDDKIRLNVAEKNGTVSFKIFDLNVNGSEPWGSCKIGYLRCSNALNETN